MKLNVPNSITLLRLVLIPVLWVLALLKLQLVFGVVFLIAGLTDFLDGFLARILHQETEFGAWFDSLADNIIAASLLFWLWLLLPVFFMDNLVLILILLAFFIITEVYGYLKYKRMIAYHLYSSKLSNILLYIFILHALFFSINQLFFYLLFIISLFCLIEGILLTLISDKLDSNRKTIFKI